MIEYDIQRFEGYRLSFMRIKSILSGYVSFVAAFSQWNRLALDEGAVDQHSSSTGVSSVGSASRIVDTVGCTRSNCSVGSTSCRSES